MTLESGLRNFNKLESQQYGANNFDVSSIASEKEFANQLMLNHDNISQVETENLELYGTFSIDSLESETKSLLDNLGYEVDPYTNKLSSVKHDAIVQRLHHTIISNKRFNAYSAFNELLGDSSTTKIAQARKEELGVNCREAMEERMGASVTRKSGSFTLSQRLQNVIDYKLKELYNIYYRNTNKTQRNEAIRVRSLMSLASSYGFSVPFVSVLDQKITQDSLLTNEDHTRLSLLCGVTTNQGNLVSMSYVIKTLSLSNAEYTGFEKELSNISLKYSDGSLSKITDLHKLHTIIRFDAQRILNLQQQILKASNANIERNQFIQGGKDSAIEFTKMLATTLIPMASTAIYLHDNRGNIDSWELASTFAIDLLSIIPLVKGIGVLAKAGKASIVASKCAVFEAKALNVVKKIPGFKNTTTMIKVAMSIEATTLLRDMRSDLSQSPLKKDTCIKLGLLCLLMVLGRQEIKSLKNSEVLSRAQEGLTSLSGQIPKRNYSNALALGVTWLTESGIEAAYHKYIRD